MKEQARIDVSAPHMTYLLKHELKYSYKKVTFVPRRTLHEDSKFQR